MESLLSTQSANQLLRHKGQNTLRNSDNTLTPSELNFTVNNQIFTQIIDAFTNGVGPNLTWFHKRCDFSKWYTLKNIMVCVIEDVAP